MSNVELLPCPFCGGEASKESKGLGDAYAYASEVSYTCKSCGCSRAATGDTSKGGYADNSTVEKRALKAWNTRTPPPDYALVPLEPTRSMIKASANNQNIHEVDANRVYKAMIKAAGELE